MRDQTILGQSPAKPTVAPVLLAIIGWLATAAGPAFADPDVTNRPDCGFPDDPVEDFTLTDENPTSPSHGQEISLSGLQGKVVFLMFIRSSCGHCQSLAPYLDDILASHQADWGDDVAFVLVNLAGYEADLPTFCGLHDLPTVQDTSAAAVADRVGASLYWNYILRPDGRLFRSYYTLYLPTYQQRLEADIEEALGR
jgi:thiol-disulfide isomerase/thioredoxin